MPVQYKKARLGIAVAPTPAGPYVYYGSFQPHGEESRDFTVFQERPPHARPASAGSFADGLDAWLVHSAPQSCAILKCSCLAWQGGDILLVDMLLRDASCF